MPQPNPQTDPSIIITTSDLPDGNQKQIIFEDSGFFKQVVNGKRPKLPSPTEVRARAHKQVSAQRPPPVIFASLHLLVKYGSGLTTSEAQCLWAVGKYLKGKVPVPELYGWCRDGKDLFIYMELVQGPTLNQRWSSLTETQRTSVCEQLRSMVRSLRLLKQDPNNPFIGSFGGGPTTDITFEYSQPGSLFTSCKAFLDRFSTLYLDRIPRHPNAQPDPYRKDLPDNVPITFTHSDFHRANIIVSAAGPPKILAILDWHQSGWYPAYWEYCKAQYVADPESEWATKHINSFIAPCPEKVYDAWYFYQQAKGHC